MTLKIQSTPEDPGILTALWVDGRTGYLLAIDDEGYDRMGLVDRAFLQDTLKKDGLWDVVPVYTGAPDAGNLDPDL